MTRFALPLLVLLASCAPALAHPLPNFRYDRELDVRLGARTVEVRYVLLVSFWTMFTDSQKLFTPEEIEQMGGKLREVSRRYCEKMAPLMAQALEAKLGGAALQFRATKLDVEQDRDHARFRFVFQAPWRPAGGGPENAFTFEDRNFEGETGAVWLVVKPDESALDVKELVEPEDLRKRDPSQYKPGDAARARRASAVFTVPGLPPLGAETPPTPPAPGSAPAPEPAPPVVEQAPDEGFFTLLFERGPKALFDTNFGLGMLLFTAALFGAFHAFAPGHGKSVAAAFLVGEQGTYRQAALLGLSTTLAHTGSVILIAGVFYLRYRESVPAEAQHWLGLFGGLLVLFVGMWLFMRRLRGKVDHVHLFGGCADMCGNHAAAPRVPECRAPVRGRDATGEQVQVLRLATAKTPLSWVRVVLLGIGAGAIPCVDAVLLLMLAVSAGKLGLALPLLVAFSVGLSSVLVLVGSLVVAIHRTGRRVSGEDGWFRLLPTASAVLLMGMGLWMARDAWKGFTAGVQ
ncbi:cytochrome c biogenesis protein CcdA [Gemmata sp. JC717]|uniref:HoxN/HupN/NixA family nickel/cobalt transporter n=1 Tax=Gemmata algarum TaxID=2975278 RepID=UPI0021BB4679|nr:cytochrome c biogenesis protein CcdA [Gemmata algarum]MDY3553802.1 cytochrome c biogenesis protein CcdA [Gemmata algarum]